MVLAVQGHQAGAPDRGREEPALVEPVDLLPGRVQHQGRDVEPRRHRTRRGGGLRDGRRTPSWPRPRPASSSSSQPFCSSVASGIIMRGEHAAERRVRARPAHADHLVERALDLELLGRLVPQRRRVAVVEQQPADPIGMPGRVGDRDRSALRHGHEGEPVEPGVVDDRLEIADARLEREVVTSQSDSPYPRSSYRMTVANSAEVGKEVAPDRALPVELEVAEPARRDDQRRAGAVDRIRDPHAVGGPAEPDLLRRRGGATRRRHVVDATPRPSPDSGGQARSEGHRAGRGDRRPHRL